MLAKIAYFLFEIETSHFYDLIVFYIGAYPLFGGILWLTSSIFFYNRRETVNEDIKFDLPLVSIIISAFNEEKYIANNLTTVCAIDYPAYEIIYVDDGSKDNTSKVLMQFADEGKIRVISKSTNEGKAMAINDAIMCSSGEIIVVFDADSEPDPDVLYQIVKNFRHPRVGAVAGHPCVKNLGNFLTRLQLIEYTAIIGMIRRSQRIWGRIMAFSGVIFALRRSAFFYVGGFTPSCATEDMELTWKLQIKYWDVFYEPHAVVKVVVPHTYKGLFRQRIRWGKGLMHTLHQHFDIPFKWKLRRMWPVFYENMFSTFWAICLVILGGLWLFTFILGFPVPPLGVSLLPLAWGITIATLSLVLCSVAFFMERTYVKGILRYYPYSIYYPIYYWMIIALVAVIVLPALFIPQKAASTWISER